MAVLHYALVRAGLLGDAGQNGGAAIWPKEDMIGFLKFFNWFKCESFTELDTGCIFFHDSGQKRGLSQMLQTDGKLSW